MITNVKYKNHYLILYICNSELLKVILVFMCFTCIMYSSIYSVAQLSPQGVELTYQALIHQASGPHGLHVLVNIVIATIDTGLLS